MKLNFCSRAVALPELASARVLHLACATTLSILAVLVPCFASADQAPEPAARHIYLRAGQLLNPVDGKVSNNAVITIAGDRVVTVGDSDTHIPEGAEVTRIFEPRKDVQQCAIDRIFPGNPGDQLHSGVPHGDLERVVTGEDTVDAARDNPLERRMCVRIRLRRPLIVGQRFGILEGATNLTAEKPM